MNTTDVPELKAFLGAYFHQDWELDAADPDGVIAQFVDSHPGASELGRVVAQIDSYLNCVEDDGVIEADLLSVFGCYYLPSADGLHAGSWLRHVADELRAMSNEI